MPCKPPMKTSSHSFPFTPSQLPVKVLIRQNDLQACVMNQACVRRNNQILQLENNLLSSQAVTY